MEKTMDIVEKEKDTSDIDIIKRVIDGDEYLYEVVIRRYNGYLYKVGRSYGYNHEDVEDLMQETYVNTYKHLKDFEERASFKTWIVRIMLNQCYHKKQKHSYQKEQAASEDIQNENQLLSNKNVSNGDKEVQNLELKKVIEEATQQLPEKYRMVFSLRELTGLSVAETAKSLKISKTNVKVRLNRAKKKLQTEIKKSYTSAEIFEFNLIYCDGVTERSMAGLKELD